MLDLLNEGQINNALKKSGTTWHRNGEWGASILFQIEMGSQVKNGEPSQKSSCQEVHVPVKFSRSTYQRAVLNCE